MSLLSKIFTQAEKTFSCVNKECFKNNFHNLKRLVDEIKWSDLELNSEHISKSTFQSPVSNFFSINEIKLI
jgi:hypothetical protein